MGLRRFAKRLIGNVGGDRSKRDSYGNFNRLSLQSGDSASSFCHSERKLGRLSRMAVAAVAKAKRLRFRSTDERMKRERGISLVRSSRCVNSIVEADSFRHQIMENDSVIAPRVTGDTVLPPSPSNGVAGITRTDGTIIGASPTDDGSESTLPSPRRLFRTDTVQTLAEIPRMGEQSTSLMSDDSDYQESTLGIKSVLNERASSKKHGKTASTTAIKSRRASPVRYDEETGARIPTPPPKDPGYKPSPTTTRLDLVGGGSFQETPTKTEKSTEKVIVGSSSLQTPVRTEMKSTTKKAADKVGKLSKYTNQPLSPCQC